MQKIKAAAVVKKSNPKLDVKELYDIRDKKEIHVGKDEKIVEVNIEVK